MSSSLDKSSDKICAQPGAPPFRALCEGWVPRNSTVVGIEIQNRGEREGQVNSGKSGKRSRI
jgi:hypothetical protein